MDKPRQYLDRLRRPTAAVLSLATVAVTGGGYYAIDTRPSQHVTPTRPATQEVVVPVAAVQPPDIATELQTDITATLADYKAKNPDYQGEIQLAVRDRTTGTIYQYTSVPPTESQPDPLTKTYNTASTVKLSILEELLLQKQVENAPFNDCPEIPMPTQLTCDELSHAIPMIEESSDDDASALWVQEGAPSAINDLNNQIGATRSTGEPNSQWGWSQTTALDQLNVVGLLQDQDSPLSPSSKTLATFLLDHVVPEQRWGISGGVPADATVMVKNGWMDYTQKQEGPWTINSIGTVSSRTGANYDIAEFSDGNASMSEGIEVVETVSKVVYDNLTPAAS